MTMFTILAEALTLGQILHNWLNGLATLASLMFAGAGIFFQWQGDLQRRNIAFFALIATIVLWLLFGAILFPIGPAKTPESIN